MSTSTLVHASAHATGLPDRSVHMIATSPPYWGLRKYAGDQDVEWPTVTYTPMAGLPSVTVDAWRGPLGLEPDPLAYVAHIVLVFRELWRVLRDDGVCFLNLGDSYAANRGYQVPDGKWVDVGNNSGAKVPPGLKPKDLCMIPARVALALQADGWYLRSAIVWAKGVSFLPDYAGSVMPESVTDRPTKAHEDVFLLAKRAKYYWDAEAVKEAGTFQAGTVRRALTSPRAQAQGRQPSGNEVDGWVTETGSRNLRDVWVINPQPYAGAHFATWPEDLVRPMILAGSSARGVCPQCGKPWVRVVEVVGKEQQRWRPGASVINAVHNGQVGASSVLRTGNVNIKESIGWSPSCACDAGDPIPATVLDPFSGSGTTGRVALALGRNYVGVDLADEYHDTLAADRLSNLQMEMTL